MLAKRYSISSALSIPYSSQSVTDAHHAGCSVDKLPLAQHFTQQELRDSLRDVMPSVDGPLVMMEVKGGGDTPKVVMVVC